VKFHGLLRKKSHTCFAEDVLAAGMLVADVLVLAGDCTPYKCYVICSLTSYEKIKKLENTEEENTEKQYK
jgi:hypothetical protein